MTDVRAEPWSSLTPFKTMQVSLAEYELAEVNSIVSPARICLLTPGFPGFTSQQLLSLSAVLKRKETLEMIIAEDGEVVA